MNFTSLEQGGGLEMHVDRFKISKMYNFTPMQLAGEFGRKPPLLPQEDAELWGFRAPQGENTAIISKAPVSTTWGGVFFKKEDKTQHLSLILNLFLLED